jgi:hypothetical protein
MPAYEDTCPGCGAHVRACSCVQTPRPERHNPNLLPMGKLYCGSCDTLREFVDWDALFEHRAEMHRGRGICGYCGERGSMVISGDIDLEFWCVDEDACEQRQDARP